MAEAMGKPSSANAEHKRGVSPKSRHRLASLQCGLTGRQCLENDEIGARLKQSPGLPRQNIHTLLLRRSGRAQRPDGARDENTPPPVARITGFHRDFHRRMVDVRHFGDKAMLQQRYIIGAEGIGRYDIRSRRQIFRVDFTDKLRIRDTNFIIATVRENVATVQLRSHGAIENNQLLQQKMIQFYALHAVHQIMRSSDTRSQILTILI